jgi:hypothetical protein
MKKKLSKKVARKTKTSARPHSKARALPKRKAVTSPKRGQPTSKKAAGKVVAKKKTGRKSATAPAKAGIKKAGIKKKVSSSGGTDSEVRAKAIRRPSRHAPVVPKRRPSRPDDADAFLRVRGGDPSNTKDDFAEELAEDFVGAATSGEEQGIESRDTVLDEEAGGPFVTTPATREFADGVDASNPEDAEREPFPRA